jgi:Cys-rich repeat protein
MNDKFDELAKGMAQSVTRRGALKKFGVGLAGIALATLGLANKAGAAQPCNSDADCPNGKVCKSGICTKIRFTGCDCGVYGFGCPPHDYNCMARCNAGC